MDIKPAHRPVTKSKSAPSLTRAAATHKPITLQTKRKRKLFRLKRKTLIRYSIFALNLLVVLGAIFIVVYNRNNNAAVYGTRDDSVPTNPLDQLNAVDIAVNVARMTNLAETTSVANYADTVNSELESFTLSKDFVKLPQIITADIKTAADIMEYQTVAGDTVSQLSVRFGVTSDSIKWSNDLLNDELEPGIKLLIPPMNGIIYVVRSGDTAEKIAQTYKLSAAQVIIFNDAELTGLVPGTRIFLPNATKPAPVFNFYVRYGNNGYDPGWCTYYAAAKGGAPPGWGHARTWAVRGAQTPGWMVSKVPVPGAIAQTTGIIGDRVGNSWGHVGIVESVKYEDGQYWIKYSDMNGIAGFNRVGYSDWTPALLKFQNFIYKIQ